MRLIKFFLFIFLIFLSGKTIAQDPSTKGKTQTKKETSNGGLQLTNSRISADSLRMSFYTGDEPNKVIPFTDTLVGRVFLEFNPHWQKGKYYGNLGNLGSATYPLTQQRISNKLGVHSGVTIYDPYVLSQKDLIFMKSKIPFTQTEFHQGNELKQSYIKSFLAVELTPKLDFSFRYNNISQQGFFQSQTNKNKNLITGFNYSSKRYNAYYSLGTNSIEQQNNGGIPQDTLLDSELIGSEISVPIRLNEKSAYSYYLKNNFYMHQVFDLIQGEKNAISIFHEMDWSQERHKNYDTNPDSTYYSGLGVFENDLRHFIKIKRIDNNLGLRWENSQFVVSGQVVHQFANILNEPRTDKVHFFGVKGDLKFDINEKIGFKGQFKQLNSSLGNELYLNGHFKLDFKDHQFDAFYTLKSNITPILYNFSSVSGTQIYDYDWSNITTNSVGGHYSYKPWGVEVDGQFDVIGNYTFMDTSFQIQQSADPVSIAKISIQKNFKWGVFNSDNLLTLQAMNVDYLPMPKLLYLNDIYYQGRIFKKKMLLKTGVSLKYIGEKALPRFDNISGLFQLSDQKEKAYPWLDLFVVTKVQSFRFYLIYSNFTGLLMPKTHYHFADHYPVFESKIKFGVNWQFRN